MVRRCACILLVEFQQQFQCEWDSACTEALTIIGNLDRKPEEIERDVKDMLGCGGRYLNLERSLGAGASLVLGLDIAESMLGPQTMCT